MFSVHQQTIRLYEKQGLINPKRSSGGTRLFSEEDVDRLEEIIYLTHKLGVNLAGVDMVLKLQKKIKKLQDDMNSLFNQTQGQLEAVSQTHKQLAQRYAKDLSGMKKRHAINAPVPEPEAASESEPVPQYEQTRFDSQPDEQEKTDDWNVEYED